MALEITYTIIDRSGERGTTTVNVPTGTILSAVTAFAAAFATVLDAIIGGRVESAEACWSVDISAITSNTAQSNSDVEERGQFAFLTTDGTVVNVNVPTIDELFVIAGTDDLDLANSAVAAFITGMEDGVAGVSPCDVGELDIVDTLFARESFRASGRYRG